MQILTISLSHNSQKRLEHKENQTKCRKMIRKPQSHVNILMHRTFVAERSRVCAAEHCG